MKNLLILAFIVCNIANIAAQDVPNIYDLPCNQVYLGSFAPDVTSTGTAKQSTTKPGRLAKEAIDGINNGTVANGKTASTKEGINQWWEVDLGRTYYLKQIKVRYPADGYVDGLKNYYIFMSYYPFKSDNLEDMLESPVVAHVFVEGVLPSGSIIPLDKLKARYVRVQQNAIGPLSILELDIPGGGDKEICGNGIDDDGNCLVDCQDYQCAPFVSKVLKTDPTCPICNDGIINVIAHGENLLYSIDGGQSYHDCDVIQGWCGFDNLGEGDYPIKVTNGICEATWLENPVTLRAPEGQAQSNCENGDFESGTFDQWETAYGIRSTGATTIGTISDRFKIIGNTGGTILDPLVPINLSFQGAYIARIGNNHGTSGNDGVIDDGELESLTYKFIVDASNTQFSFDYAAVLEDGGHTGDNPYFSYDVFYIENGQRISVQNFKQIASNNTNDNFFETIPQANGNTLNYKGWTCVEVDLSGHIGKEITAEFIIAECGPGPHFAYAYIDGLCLPTEEIKPVPQLSLDAKYCMGQTILADASESKKFTAYKWKLCKLDGTGTPISCVDGNIIKAYAPQILDVAAFYGADFECGYSYSVTLTLYNDCVDPESVEKTFEFFCDHNNIAYKDIVFCNVASLLVDITMEGTNDCQNCEIQWVPAQYLNSSVSKFPTVIGSLNVDAYKEPYTITATNSVGCRFTDVVEIVSYKVVAVTELIDSYCELNMKIVITGNKLIKSDNFSVSCLNTTTGASSQGTAIFEGSGKIVFGFPVTIDKLSPMPFSTTVIGNFSPDAFIVVGNCTTTLMFSPDNLYVGDFYFYIPNAFTPYNGDGLNDTFGPVLPFNPPPPATLHNAYWARLRVFARLSGEEVFDKELSSEPKGVPFDMNALRWDGTKNGNGILLAPDVYVWILEMKNCTHPNSDEDCETCHPGLDCQPCLPGLGCWSCNVWKGDVTMIP